MSKLQGLLEARFPPGLQNYWKSNFLRELSDEAIATLIESFREVPSSTSAIAIEQLGAAVSRTADDDTAFAHRSAQSNLLIVSSWPNPADDAVNITWTRSVWQAMQPFSNRGRVRQLPGTRDR